MDRLKKLERLEGNCVIHDEERTKIADGRYFLDVFQEMLDAGTTNRGSELIPGLKRIVGKIDDVDAFPLVGDPLVLTLEDGRRLEFFFTDDTGNIASRGDLE